MSAPDRVLPPNPSLEQQKKQAKELLRAQQRGDDAALRRFRALLPDKPDLTLADAQFVLAREHGFASWAELKRHIEAAHATPEDIHRSFRRAFEKRDARALRALFERHPEARAMIDEPLFPFDSPALAHFSGSDDVELIDVLLELGADPNRRTSWWAGGFHPLHGSSPAVADRLLRAGAEVDACAAADPTLVQQRTGHGEYAEQPQSSYHIYFWTIGNNRSPLQVAAQFDHPEALAILRSVVGPKQLFLEACTAAHEDEARRLLLQQPDLMHQLTPSDHATLADAAWDAAAPAVELLLTLGFDPAARGHDGGNALHCAAWMGCVACVRAILRHPDRDRLVHDRDPHYDAPPLGWCLHGSLNCHHPKADHAGVTRLLLAAGAEPPTNMDDVPAAVRQVIEGYGG